MATPLVTVALAALSSALGWPGAHAEVLAVDGRPPAGCEISRAEAPAPVVASGRVVLRLLGATAGGEACDAWVWVRVRVTAPALVTTRPLAAGEPLEGAVAPVEREVLPGRSPVPELPEGARAQRALPAGAALEAGSLRLGPPPGAKVAVMLQLGALSVEQVGTAVACRRGRACALLPSGQRVEGAWHGGRIELETP